MLFILSSSPLFSETRRVTLVTRIEQDGTSRLLADVTARAVRQRLERQGYAVDVAQAALPADPASFRALPEETTRELSRNIVFADGRINGAEVALTITWYDRTDDRIRAAESANLVADLSLDRSVFDVVDSVLARDADFVFGPEPGGGPSNPATDSTAAVAREKPPAGDTVSDTVPDVRATMSPESPLTTPVPITRTFGPELGFGAAPFVGAGALAPFFELAGVLSVRFSLRVPGRFLDFAFGVDVPGVAFQVAGPLDAGWGAFVPVLLDLRLGGAQTGGIVGYLQLSGGAALLVLQTNAGYDLLSVMPAFRGGIGGSIVLASRAAIAVEASFMAIVDGTDLIMGFAPGLEVTFPLQRNK